MASSSIMRLLDTARMHAPGALDGTLRLELFNACEQFMRDTCVWREYLNVYVTGTSYDYDLITLSKGVIHTLMWLGRPNPANYNNGVVVDNLLPDVPSGDFNSDFNQDFNNASTQAPSAMRFTPVDYSLNLKDASPRAGALVASGAPDAILRIRDLPNVGEVWVAEVALNVSDPTDGDGIPYVPGWITQKYKDVLLSGLLSRVMVQPAKPWTNEKAAMYHGRKFMGGIGTARNDARNGGTYNGQRWTFPQQFRTRSQRTWGGWGW